MPYSSGLDEPHAYLSFLHLTLHPVSKTGMPYSTLNPLWLLSTQYHTKPTRSRQVDQFCLSAEMGLNSKDVWGHFAPMFHLVDVFAIYAITLLGGRHAILPTFSAQDALLMIGKKTSSNSSMCPEQDVT